MELITKITIDLIQHNHLRIVKAKQNDIGRSMEITLLANGVAFPAASSDLVRIFVKKPDRKLVYNNCTVEDGKVIAPLTSQTLAVAGRALAEIELIRGESRLSNPIFELDIAQTNIDDNAIQSTDEFGVIKEWLDDSVEAATEAAEAANTAAGAANTAAGVANTAAGRANMAAEGADVAAGAANTAAGAANAAAGAANTAAGRADTAADKANAAAKTAGDNSAAAAEAARQATVAGQGAKEATEDARSLTEEIQIKLNNGDFVGPRGNDGPPGPPGQKGDPGESGITTPIAGFFTLSVDANGDLWAYSAQGDTVPDFEYDSTTGNLYFNMEVA